MRDFWKRFKAGVGNALIWGAAWAVGSVALLVVMALLGQITATVDLKEIVQVATSFGFMGVLAGGTFSGALRLAARDRTLLDLRAAPFVIGGCAIAALFSPLLPGPVWIAAVLGAGTAGGTLSLAKSAERQQLEAGGSPVSLT